MPNRFIRESCRSSKNLDRISDFEERLFWRLVTTADDYGRFQGDPELVRAACFPYRQLSVQKIDEALVQLQKYHLIDLYRVGDRQYGQFVTWEKHQGKPRSTKSKYPNKLDAFLQADVSTCTHVHADVPGHPNTNTNTDLNSSLNSEELKNKKLRAKKNATAWPDDLVLTDELRDIAKERMFDPEVEFQRAKDHCLSNGKRYADFHAFLRNWFRNEQFAKKKISTPTSYTGPYHKKVQL